MHLATTLAEQRAWMAQWRETAIALEEIKAEELQALTEAEAGRIVREILPDVDYRAYGAEDSPDAMTGLFEQQRLFGKSILLR